MPGQDVALHRAHESTSTKDGQTHSTAPEQASVHNLVVLDGRLHPGHAVEPPQAENRFSARLSIAIIAGLSAALWIAAAALVF